jgi:hypothetical protein
LAKLRRHTGLRVHGSADEWCPQPNGDALLIWAFIVVEQLTLMYLLMSLFHLPPWLRLISRLREQSWTKAART